MSFLYIFVISFCWAPTRDTKTWLRPCVCFLCFLYSFVTDQNPNHHPAPRVRKKCQKRRPKGAQKAMTSVQKTHLLLRKANHRQTHPSKLDERLITLSPLLRGRLWSPTMTSRPAAPGRSSRLLKCKHNFKFNRSTFATYNRWIPRLCKRSVGCPG